MKSLVKEVLTHRLETANENIEWMSEALARLEETQGDPKKIAQYQQWIALEVEIKVQILELLEPDTASKEK